MFTLEKQLQLGLTSRINFTFELVLRSARLHHVCLFQSRDYWRPSLCHARTNFNITIAASSGPNRECAGSTSRGTTQGLLGRTDLLSQDKLIRKFQCLFPYAREILSHRVRRSMETTEHATRRRMHQRLRKDHGGAISR